MTPWTIVHQAPLYPCYFPGKNTGEGCHFLLQGIFPIQGSNLCLLHWQADSLLSEPPGKPHLLHMAIQLFQHCLLKRWSFSRSVVFASFLKTNCPLCGSTSGLYIQLHQSIYLFLYQYDIILIVVFYNQS